VRRRQHARVELEERAVVPLPAGPPARVLDDEPRGRIGAPGEPEERVALEEAGEAGERLPDEERLLLPVLAQEARRCEPAEELHDDGARHRTLVKISPVCTDPERCGAHRDDRKRPTLSSNWSRARPDLRVWALARPVLEACGGGHDGCDQRTAPG